MTERKKTSKLKLSKLSVSILENLVEPVIGKEAIGQLKAKYDANELQKSLSEAVIQAEQQFIAEYPDKEIVEALLNLPLAKLPAIESAVIQFYKKPNESALAKALSDQIIIDYPKLPKTKIRKATKEYIRLLKIEMAGLDSEIREKIITISELAIERNTSKLVSQVGRLLDRISVPDQKEIEAINERQIFNEYIKHIEELVINKDLLKLEPFTPEVIIAVQKTRDVLSIVQGNLKAKVVDFLSNLKLLDNHEARYLVAVDLRDTDLSNMNLSKFQFTKSDLSLSTLNGANLFKTNLIRARLINSSMKDAKLREAELFQANLMESDLSYADLTSVNLSGAILSQAKLTNSKLSRANLVAATLINSDFEDADLSEADLRQAVFINANLKNANLNGAKLDEANLTGVKHLDQDVLSKVVSHSGVTLPDGTKTESKKIYKSKPNILIVEDDLDIADMLNAYFRVQGYEVHTVNYGEDGLRDCWLNHPDLVILDVNLPDMNGYEIIRTLKTDRRFSSIPVIFLTVKRNTEQRLHGYELGAQDYITKPFDIQELRLSVRNLLRIKESEKMVNPVTGLLESNLVDERLTKCLESQNPWVLLVISIENFGSFREKYGFIASDDVLRTVSSMLINSIRDLGTQDDFVGHLSESQFVVITVFSRINIITEHLQARFDQSLDYFYPNKDRENSNFGSKKLIIRMGKILPGENKFENADQLKTELLKSLPKNHNE